MTPNEHAFREAFKYFGTPMTADEYNVMQVKNGAHPHDFVKVPEVLMETAAGAFEGRTNGFGVPFEYFCGLIRVYERSAATTLHKGVFCIGTYEGLLIGIVELAYWLVKRQRFMPDVGASQDMPVRHSDGSMPGLLWAGNISKGLEPFSPDFFDVPCEIRAQVASQLVWEMMTFVVLHELSHIIMGHVGYTQEILGASHISEIASSAQNASQEQQIIQRVFEYDADLNAATTVLLGSPIITFNYDRIDARLNRQIKAIAPFLVQFLFLPAWSERAHEFKPDTSHPEPFKRMYALQKQLREHGGLSSLRSAGVYEELKKDFGSFASATGNIESAIAVLDPTVDALWSEPLKEEYRIALNAQTIALAHGFGSEVTSRDGKRLRYAD
jgi:hypothetical protein